MLILASGPLFSVLSAYVLFLHLPRAGLLLTFKSQLTQSPAERAYHKHILCLALVLTR